ncbi:MANSC domain-containing protein 1 [Bombina bombina]|uniref:MANSC domain-containing protein 1 n=1 Tax=Bombina bombina TaxID=8345 RepID=UPI00235A9A8A|nr:MANSC domain-containing protein 1 [Bombina bombina]XP_053574889.1 MANSC domain-containing protein 1 [Bombina bombina]XP_053574890.1 MANSC domain-containing protein 1 [Bombina bombina]
MRFSWCWLAWALLLFRALTLCEAQQCYTQAFPNMVIDIKKAVESGVRGSDPFHALSPEDCMTACCKEHTIAGDRDCNFFIFDTRKMGRNPNCYLFSCPNPDDCPMTPSKGVISYSLWPETSANKKSSDQYKTQDQEKSNNGALNFYNSPSPSFQNSALKEPGSVVQSKNVIALPQNSANKESGSMIDLQKLDAKESSDSAHSQNSANQGSSIAVKGQKSNIIESSSQSENSVKKESVLKLQSQSSAFVYPSPTVYLQDSKVNEPKPAVNTNNTANIKKDAPVKDSTELQNNITTQLLNLAERMEKHLERMDPELVHDPSLKVFYIAPSTTEQKATTSVNAHQDSRRLLTTTNQIKPAQAIQKIPMDFPGHQIKATTQAPDIVPSTVSIKNQTNIVNHQNVPITGVRYVVPDKLPEDTEATNPVSDSVVKNIQNRIESLSDSSIYPVPKPTKPLNVYVPKTSTAIMDLDVVHTPVQIQTTRSSPLMILHPKKLSSTYVPHVQPLTTKHHLLSSLSSTTLKTLQPNVPDQSKAKPVIHIEKSSVTARNMDIFKAGESKVPQPDDKSGLVAALIFGVLFLVVVIGMISRKVAEARRRDQYTKLDYLINGMYVDT